MEGLIKIRVEGDERQPVATCSLDDSIESRGADLNDTAMGWLRLYERKHGAIGRPVTLTREGNDYKFSC